uniref:ULP_PROTEASE domain-containing protein n=1 Tax=Heterorhabditis bacteriophora TaxID=37862 RepID=A0A1I7X1Z4_HETBA
MTASRCSQSDSPQKGSPAKSPGRKRRALDPGPSRVRVPPTPASVELALSSRPKRAIRKSVLLASGDYEIASLYSFKCLLVSIPGVKIEETDTDINCDLIVTDESEIPLSAENTSMDDTDEEKNVDLTMGGIDVETMSNLEEEADEDTMITLIKEGSDNELLENDSPPMLEKSGELKRGRGRPRKNPRDEDLLRKETLTHRDRNGRVSHLPRSKYMAEKALSKSEAERINTYNVKLFQDEVNVTDYGDTYATVIPGCLSYLLRKERIIELLTNRVEIDAIRNQGWLSSKPPRLPPLVSTKSCFAFYIEGSQVNAIRDLSNDDLKPWTTTEPVEGEPVIKPNVRKHAIVRQGSRFIPSKGDPRLADIHLTEYSAWLPRLLRLRKKIFYLARGRTGQIIGNVLILYDYTVAGEAPTVLNVVHGNDLLKGLQHDMSMERDVGDTENPFVEGVITGTRGEKFLKVRPSKLGWINNKTLLLKYLINEPTILDDAGYLNTHVPYLPPLIEGKGVFVHFAPASLVADHLQHTGDGLSPWTHQGAAANHRVRTVKRALVQDTQGFFQMTKEDWQTTGLALVETITILSRCPRLRKRVVFVQRQNMVVLGIVCFMYEYIKEGRIPEIIKDNTKAHPAPNISRVAVVAECRRKKRDDSGNGGEEFINVEDLVDDDVDENVPEIISGSPVPPGDVFLFYFYSENPTCYRTKVRKIGVESDAQTGHFRLRDGHYKTCPFHLVHLYSIHPRENRLRKKRFSRQRQRRSLSNLLLRDVTDDVSDLSESEKESPFSHGAQQNTDGAVFLPLSDIEFLNDRNRQLHYLINKPHLLYVHYFIPMTYQKFSLQYVILGNQWIALMLVCLCFLRLSAAGVHSYTSSMVVKIDDVEYIPEWLQSDIASTRRQGDINSVLSSLVDDASMDVSHTEEIAGSVGLSEDIKKHSTAFSLTSALGTSQAEAIFRYTHTLLETGNEDETFDAIWRLLLSRNESRLLHNIKTDFGVEIVADVMVNDVVEDEAIEVEVSEGGHLVATEVVDEETIPDNVHIDETQTIEMTRNANIGEAQVVEVAEDVQVMDETEMQEVLLMNFSPFYNKQHICVNSFFRIATTGVMPSANGALTKLLCSCYSPKDTQEIIYEQGNDRYEAMRQCDKSDSAHKNEEPKEEEMTTPITEEVTEHKV